MGRAVVHCREDSWLNQGGTRGITFSIWVVLAKIATVVIAIAVVAVLIVNLTQRKRQRGELRITRLSEQYKEMQEEMSLALLDSHQQKLWLKAQKKKHKQEAKAAKAKAKLNAPQDKATPLVYVLDFKGNMDAHEVSSLREEVTAVLAVATPQDQVVVRLESPGGVVHGYGLAASQLQRLREKQIPLTVAVDKVAASGGYMMACVADKIVAAPFSIIGSIGVVAQIPNFNRFLKNKEIDIELHTAGQYKRTLTLLGKTRKKDVKNSAKISMKRIISLKILYTVCAQRSILNRSRRASTGTASVRRRKGWWMKLEPATICCSI